MDFFYWLLPTAHAAIAGATKIATKAPVSESTESGGI